MTNALQELKPYPNWVCWREQQHPTKPDKVKKPIISPVTGLNGSHSNPDDWATYEVAKTFYLNNKSRLGLKGLGFVFSSNLPYVGIDLDECVNDGQLNAFAQRQLNVFKSYAEYSYSGRGIHIIGKTSLMFSGISENKYNPIEIYRDNRFFVVTGKHVEDTPETLEDITTPLSYRVAANVDQTDSHEITIDDVQEMLQAIPGEGLDYNVWCRILMAVHSKFPGADGKAVVDAWTGQYSLKNELDQKWRSFRKSGITIGTLVHFAKEHGWVQSVSNHPLDKIVPKLSPIQKVQVKQVIEELAEKRAWEIYHKLLLTNTGIVDYSRPVVEHLQLGYRQKDIDRETGEITPGAISVPYIIDGQVVAIEFREDEGTFSYDGKVGLFHVKPMLEEETGAYGLVLPDSFLAIDTYLSGAGVSSVYGLPHTTLELALPEDIELYCIFQHDTPLEMLEVLDAYGTKFFRVKSVEDMLKKLPRGKVEEIARQGKRLKNVI